MQIETRGTATLGEASFDATHPTNGRPCRVLAVNDDDPASVKWLVAFTDGTGEKRVETVDAVAPAKLLGRTRPWEW
ncbi:hypothetical protein NKI09_15210 [Mesorhizobium sp. M0757]|uniref:hypothetical protein n=1 Tax=Mesorhizobium sp. M0757 TaxID=2956993 RepID=UPI00333CB816